MFKSTNSHTNIKYDFEGDYISWKIEDRAQRHNTTFKPFPDVRPLTGNIYYSAYTAVKFALSELLIPCLGQRCEMLNFVPKAALECFYSDCPADDRHAVFCGHHAGGADEFWCCAASHPPP